MPPTQPSPKGSGDWPAFAQALLHEQPYDAGSADQELLAAQTLLCRETREALYAPPPTPPSYVPGSRPELEGIVERIAGGQRESFAKVAALTRWCSRIPRNYPSAEASTAAGFYGDFSSFQWGGDEAAVIAKGSPWPQELARVLATLAQISGVPARLVFLYRDGSRDGPPEMHSVVEAWLPGDWTVFDPCANRFFPWPHHGYASALALQQQPRLVDQTPEHGHVRYVDSAFYGTLGIASYRIEDRDQYHYKQQPAHPHDLPQLRRAAAVFAR